jgi:inorganic pyrophosphatase
VLCMHDEKGINEKILAVPVADPRFDGVEDISEIHKHWLSEIENFFNTYKVLEGKETRIEGRYGAKQAREVIRMYRS